MSQFPLCMSPTDLIQGFAFKPILLPESNRKDSQNKNPNKKETSKKELQELSNGAGI